MSTGGIDSLPEYSLAIAYMITISVDEKEALASTMGAINVVAQPIRKIELANSTVSRESVDVYGVFTICYIQKNFFDDILQDRLALWRWVLFDYRKYILELTSIELAIYPA